MSEPITYAVTKEELETWMELASEIAQGALMRIDPRDENQLEEAYLKLRIQGRDLSYKIADKMGVCVATHNLLKEDSIELKV